MGLRLDKTSGSQAVRLEELGFGLACSASAFFYPATDAPAILVWIQRTDEGTRASKASSLLKALAGPAKTQFFYPSCLCAAVIRAQRRNECPTGRLARCAPLLLPTTSSCRKQILSTFPQRFFKCHERILSTVPSRCTQPFFSMGLDLDCTQP